MHAPSHVLYFLIVGAEIAFWLVLVAGLAVRYLLARDALSRWMLMSLPLIDLLLLAFMAFDLRAGTHATFAHGLAAAYVGFTVAFGAVAIRWADAHFAHRFASGPKPAEAPVRGWGAVRFELDIWLRCIAAWIIALVLIEVLIVSIENEEITQPLRAWYRYGLGSIVVWFVVGPAWSLVFFRRERG